MIVTKKDDTGKIVAYGEFRIVDEQGKEDPNGKYAWINDVWVHENFRTKEGFNWILQEFITIKHLKLPWVEYIYWTRQKHGGRMSCYEIRRIVKDEPIQKV